MIRSIAAVAVALATLMPGGAVASDPSTPPVGTLPPPALTPRGPADAALLVIARDARFAGVGPLDPTAIGQAAWYEAYPTADGYEVIVTLGWGDCPAGCIGHHSFTYLVAPDGTSGPPLEAGDPLPLDFVPPTSSGDAQVVVTLVSGPSCAVETVPPDPACDPRPVVGGVVSVRDASFVEVARLVTGDDGRASMSLAGGPYLFEPLPSAGLLGTPEAAVTWVLGPGHVQLTFAYDTGIR